MADTAITAKRTFGTAERYLEYYSNAALTTGVKAEFVITRHCRIADVIIDSETAGSGGSADIIDIHKNGTTIYTTQGNRPTINSGDTGMWTRADEPEIDTLEPGDVLLIEVDQVCSSAGSARAKVLIVLAAR